MANDFSGGVLDVSSAEFDVDVFLSKQLKEKGLDDLVKEEESTNNSVRRLDSEVHQLVYENYNKFLTATTTVRKIQDEFNLLDKEMDAIRSNMSSISSLIGELGGVLGSQNSDVVQLGSSFKAIRSLQSIFDLPRIVQALLDNRKFSELVRVIQSAELALEKYSDVSNVSEIISKIKSVKKSAMAELSNALNCASENIEILPTVVDLLIKLGQDHAEIERKLLESIESSLRNDLLILNEESSDVLDLVDKGCSTFLPNFTLLSNLYQSLFSSSVDKLKLCVKPLLDEFHGIVARSFLSPSEPQDCSIVIRALDRYYRKMSTCSNIIPGINFSSVTVELIRQVANHEIGVSRTLIATQASNSVDEVREYLLNADADIQSVLTKFDQAYVSHVKTALANLLLFTASDVTFSNLPPSEFQSQFSCDVYENLFIASIKELGDYMKSFGCPQMKTMYVNPLLLLCLAVSLNNFSNKSAMYLSNLCKEQFSLSTTSSLTSRRYFPSFTVGDRPSCSGISDVISTLKEVAQSLLHRFAIIRGLEFGENLNGSSDAVFKPSASPTGVRASVRRCIEQVSNCEAVLQSVLGDDTRKESRPARRTGEIARDSLWCEGVHLHQPIPFNKSAVLSLVVTVLLKSFIERHRFETYGKFASEHIQVDCYYLQRQLAPFVADEVVLNSLLDQALSTALKRCHDPVLVHPTRLQQICSDK